MLMHVFANWGRDEATNPVLRMDHAAQAQRAMDIMFNVRLTADERRRDLEWDVQQVRASTARVEWRAPPEEEANPRYPDDPQADAAAVLPVRSLLDIQVQCINPSFLPQ